jgi:hypothetical protein
MSLIFFFCIAPSDISPAVNSPSLPEPAVILGRRTVLVCNPGVLGRLSVVAPDAFFSFFLVDSLPLDSDKAGEPARFNDFPFLPISESFCLPCGVVEPFALWDLDLSLPSPWPSLFSSSFFSSSFPASSSSSELSSSLYWGGISDVC